MLKICRHMPEYIFWIYFFKHENIRWKSSSFSWEKSQFYAFIVIYWRFNDNRCSIHWLSASRRENKSSFHSKITLKIIFRPDVKNSFSPSLALLQLLYSFLASQLNIHWTLFPISFPSYRCFIVEINIYFEIVHFSSIPVIHWMKALEVI
jgi:hypothetical protein